jgi:glycine/D-amino acid oxidase-like deaminating enzyme
LFLKGNSMSSDSYWQQTAPIIPLSTNLPHSVDVAVIGGGLFGTATTYWLTRAGVSVALLEREAIGWGATGRNGGFIVAGPAESYTEAIERLGHETARAVMTDTLLNQHLVRQVLAEEEIICDYRDPGHLRLALSASDEEQLRAEVASFQADGFSVEYLERNAVQHLINTELSPVIRGGRLKRGQATVHSARFVRGLAQAALRHGARAYRTEVQHLLPEGEHVRLQTTCGSINAAQVIVATNVWIGALVPQLEAFILSQRQQALAFAPLPPIFSTHISAGVTTGEYFQQTPDGTIILGGCSSVAPEEDCGIWEMTPTTEVQNAIEAVLPHLFPALPALRVTQRWAGLLDRTSDTHPIVDGIPTLPHVLVVCGLSGHGMPFGLRFGQLLTQCVTTGSVPVELSPYRLDRPTLKSWIRA